MTGQSPAQAMKQAIRQRIIADRASLPQGERTRLSREITARLLLLPSYREAGTVLGYMSFGAEFASHDWVRRVLADGKTLLLPRVNQQARELELYRVTDLGAQLAPGAYGILEPLPQSCAAARLEDADFVLLPGVAFGRDGARLGYGGGYYDRLLARSQRAAELVSAAYSMQIVEHLPQEATDFAVRWLVTENETIQCGS